MRLDGAFLRSKVARRVFVLFILCALVPITVLAVVSFQHVTQELQEQSRKRLHQASKAVGMAIYERLLFLEAELKLFARELGTAERLSETVLRELGADLESRFEAIGLVRGGQALDLIGRVSRIPHISEGGLRHLRAGETLIVSQRLDDVKPRVVMSRALDAATEHPSLLIAELNAKYLWGLGEQGALPARTEMCVLEEVDTVHVCSFQATAPFRERIRFALSQSAPSFFEWSDERERYLVSFWSIPLKFRFHSPTWTVVLGEPKAAAMAPLANFKYTFTLVVLLSVWIVSLLSLVQIRRHLVPLEQLGEGTRRIGGGDFSSRVKVESGDEFQELANSFNAMAARLGKQFSTLATISEIDRAVLSSLDKHRVVDTVLSRIPDVFPSGWVGVTLRDADLPHVGWMYLRGGSEPSTVVEPVELTLDALQALHEHPVHHRFGEEGLPAFLSPLARRGVCACLVLPLFRGERLSGFIALGYEHASGDEEDVAQARQLADQVAAALANAEDIAERQRAEALLVDSNRRLEQALQELTTTQRQMIQQERLRALGQMASGIAHDFNNTLSPIVGFSELLLLNAKSLDDKDKVKEHLRIINTAARDASKVVGHLRDFYRPPVQQEMTAAVDLHQLVAQTIRLTQPKWKDQALANGITILVESDVQEVPPVRGDESELREVLTNLIFNAVDAMPTNGTITLRARAEAEWVRLEVQDTGVGMEEDVRQRCLEPFFSTKGDRGTGLGLSMVYGIIRRHHGTIDIESQPGVGTTVIIRLPVQSEPSGCPHPETEELWPNLHVLAVDDDPLVGRVTTEYLSSLGYTVETACSGKDALEKFASGRFDLVITDQGMPGMSGAHLAQEIKKSSPETPVLMMSGLGLDEPTLSQAQEAVNGMLPKPLTMAALRRALAQAKRWKASVHGHSVG